MRNGIASRIASIPAPRKAAALLLTLLVVWIGGCDTAVAPSLPARPAGDTQEIALPERSRMDPARNRMWVLTHDRVVLHDITTSKKIEIDLPGWQWADIPYACLPDLALGPKGEAIVTSNVVPTLWRIDPETLAVSVHNLALDADRGRDVGFSGLAYSAQHGAFFAINDAHRSLWRIDPLLKTGQEVRPSEPIRTGTCEAPLTRVPREAD
jgi:hypothetical protein